MIKDVVATVYDLVKTKLVNFILLMVVIVLSVFFESFGFAMIIPLMESLLQAESDSSVSKMFSNIFLTLNIEMTVLSTGTLFISVIVIKNFLIIFRGYLRSNFSYSLKFEAMKKIKSSYITMPFGKFVRYKHGDLVNNVITETQNTAMGILQLTEMITGLLLIPAFVFLMLASSFQLTLFMIVLGILLYILISKVVGRYARRVGKQEINLNQSTASQVSENLSAMRNIRILGVGEKVILKLSETLSQMKKLLVRWDTFSASTSPLAEVALVFVIVGYIFYISFNFDIGYFEKVLPVLSMLVVVAYKSMTQLSRLLVNRMAVERYLPSMKLVNEMMKEIDQSHQDKHNQTFNIDSFDTIKFKDVSFGYKRSKNVLSKISFDISFGETTVIMGASGSGKSTIIDLLLGLYSPNSGQILVGDKDLLDINLDSWRKLIGYVGQDVFLFHGTILENIKVGSPTASAEMVKEIAKKVGLNEFIMDLPDGYDTEVGDRGVMLSGGQRQRISIARALLREPMMLVLDEATSALDKETAIQITSNVFSLMKGKTVFVVSHKREVLKYADKVLRLQNGKFINE